MTSNGANFLWFLPTSGDGRYLGAGLCARPLVGQQGPIHRLFDDYLRTGVPNATVVKVAVHGNVAAPE